MDYKKEDIRKMDIFGQDKLGLETEQALSKLVAQKLQAVLPDLAADLVEQYLVEMRFGFQTNAEKHRFLVELDVTPKTQAEKREEAAKGRHQRKP